MITSVRIGHTKKKTHNPSQDKNIKKLMSSPLIQMKLLICTLIQLLSKFINKIILIEY